MGAALWLFYIILQNLTNPRLQADRFAAKYVLRKPLLYGRAFFV